MGAARGPADTSSRRWPTRLLRRCPPTLIWPSGTRWAAGCWLWPSRQLRPGRAVYLDPAWFVATDRDIRATFPLNSDGQLISEDEFARRYPQMTREHVRVMLDNFTMWDQSIVNGNGYAFADAETMDPPKPAPVPSLILLADPTDMVTDGQQHELPAHGYEIRVQSGAGHSLWKEDLGATLAALDGWI